MSAPGMGGRRAGLRKWSGGAGPRADREQEDERPEGRGSLGGRTGFKSRRVV